MKKTVILGVLCCTLPSLVLAGRGGSSFAGGMAGGMMGGLISGAMTRESAPRSKSVSASVVREIDKLENAVRYDLVKLDERIRTLERTAGKGGGGDAEDLRQDIGSLKKMLKKIEKKLEGRFEALEEQFASMENNVKRIETKVKKLERASGDEPIKAAPVALEKSNKNKSAASSEVPIGVTSEKE